jgi:hypothetical protein
MRLLLLCLLVAGCSGQPPKYKGYRLEINERPAMGHWGSRLGVVVGR